MITTLILGLFQNPDNKSIIHTTVQKGKDSVIMTASTWNLVNRSIGRAIQMKFYNTRGQLNKTQMIFQVKKSAHAKLQNLVPELAGSKLPARSS